MTHKIEILAERSKIPADGKSATKLCIRYPEPPGSEVELKLAKRGSFEQGEVVREKTFPVVNGEVNLTVYPPSRPGPAFLTGEGFRHRIDFVAASFIQGLVYEWIPTLAYALVFALVLRTYAVASFIIPSGSMEDTLLQHDLLIANKLSYKLLGQNPQRGDVMIFKPPHEPHKDYIKRVIGVPGDTVEVKNGVVYVNDQPLEEEYVKEPPHARFNKTTLGPDEYFMMGDNRNHSQDSRVWGPVKRSSFEGKALFIFWPPSRIGLLTDEHPAFAKE
ncbi:MAG TPA: signal peptidase I [Firmicutes bacterium]|nr:signal peptidase I [Bacillota bacterium]